MRKRRGWGIEKGGTWHAAYRGVSVSQKVGGINVFDGCCYCKTSSSFAVCNKRDKFQANTVVTQRGIPLA